MMIEPIKLSDVPMRAKNTANLVEKYLKDFWETFAVAGKVKVPVGRKAKNVCIAYRKAGKRLGLPILVMQRGNDVYVVKKKRRPWSGNSERRLGNNATFILPADSRFVNG